MKFETVGGCEAYLKLLEERMASDRKDHSRTLNLLHKLKAGSIPSNPARAASAKGGAVKDAESGSKT